MSHRWKIFIAVAVVMLALIGVWVVMMSLVPSNDVAAYRRSLVTKGEKLKISEVTPPPVPAGENGVSIVNGAFGLLTPMGDDPTNMTRAMLAIAPGKAMVCFEQPDVRDYGARRSDSTTNSWSNEMAVVEADRPATELLRQAQNYPALDFGLDYSKGFAVLLPHLGPLKRSTQRLAAEAMCDLHDGDAGSATTNICAMLALVNGEQDERFLISQLVRIAMTHVAVGPSWELLQTTNVTDAELAMLQTNWERLEFIRAMGNAVLMERACGETEIKKMRESKAEFNLWAGSGGSGSGGLPDFLENAKSIYADFMWHVSWSYSDELRMLQNDQLILQTARTIETNGFFNPACSNMMNQLSVTNEDSWLTAFDVPDLHWAFSEGTEVDAHSVARTMPVVVGKRMVITAIALKRYQLKHGNYPENLGALVPEYLTAVPLDPVDGKPLRYRLNADGTYALYSIGENGKDDGGNPALAAGASRQSLDWLNRDALDWVWPQPASEAEIQYYYAHPPK